MDDQKQMKTYPSEGEPEGEALAEDSEKERLSKAEACSDSIREAAGEAAVKSSWLRELYEWTQAIAVAVVLALFINQFIFAMVQVEGSSMLPTLQNKDRLVITKLFYKPQPKDIVVVKSHALGKHIIKRVIAVPGDTLDIHPATGDVLLNGEVLDEPYIKEKLRSAGGANRFPLTVPEDRVFVMGDNRNNSRDSRDLGLIDFRDIVGRASLRVTPFSRFGTLYQNCRKK